MKLFQSVTAIFILILLLLSSTSLIIAQNREELKLPNTVINPGSFYYPVKRAVEKGREMIIFSKEGKRSYYNSLLKTRLSELDYVTEKKILSEIQSSSERFAYQAGILTEEAMQSNKNDKENLINDYAKYSKFLDVLRDRFPANSSFWMLVQHDINTLDILSNKLK